MNFDVITVGGGIAGSTLAIALARAGCSVLVLERETRFRDRVRGENMLPWGVAAARRLGIVDALLAAGGHQPRSWITHMFGDLFSSRDLPATTPQGETALNVYHPDMQEALLERASVAGAQVRRGAKAVRLDAGPGRFPTVTFEWEGQCRELRARIVVGADGRTSQVRRWGGFEVNRNPDLLTIAGTLFQCTDIPDTAVHLVFGTGRAMLLAPLGGGRVRTYFVYRGVDGRQGLSGKDKLSEFINLCQGMGLPKAWFASAKSVGPLAEFEGSDHWVERPAKNGVVLIGDAAASSDPSWGCGLSLTMLDVEHLAQALSASDDWTNALGHYAGEHDDYYSTLRRVLGWMTDLMWTSGQQAEVRRKSVLPRMIADPGGFPDLVGLGPFGPSNDQARKNVLGLG